MGTDRDGVLKTRGDKHNGRRHHLRPIIAFGAGYEYFLFNAYFCVPNIHCLVPTPLTAFYKNTLANVEQSATLPRHMPVSPPHNYNTFLFVFHGDNPTGVTFSFDSHHDHTGCGWSDTQLTYLIPPRKNCCLLCRLCKLRPKPL